MEYKGYIGEFTFDEKRALFLGHISNIKGIIMFQGKSIEILRYAFKDSVNEHLAWCPIPCLKHGKSPEIPSNDNLEREDDLDSA